MGSVLHSLGSLIGSLVGSLVGWLRGGASASSSYVLAVLARLPRLVEGGLQLAGAAALVALFVAGLWGLKAQVNRQPLDEAWARLLQAIGAYLSRERRWLRLFKAFVRNRYYIKHTAMFLRLVSLIRLTYVFVEDICLTCWWYFLILDDYVRDLVADFLTHYEDYYVESDNLCFVYWYFFYIFREQVIYYRVAERALWGRTLANRRRRLLQWRAHFQQRRIDHLFYYFWGSLRLERSLGWAELRHRGTPSSPRGGRRGCPGDVARPSRGCAPTAGTPRSSRRGDRCAAAGSGPSTARDAGGGWPRCAPTGRARPPCSRSPAPEKCRRSTSRQSRGYRTPRSSPRSV